MERTIRRPPPLIFVGSFLSSPSLKSPSAGEHLAARLAAAGWPILTTSRRRWRPARLLDMLAAIWRRRRRYAAAHVELYSGRAFLWGELACALLRRLGKPHLVALHGGDLPAFAGRHPERLRRLLAGAAVVTAPSPYLQRTLAPYRAGIELLPNALELRRYPFRRRRRLAPRLVWLRAFHAVYDPSSAVRVLARLLPLQPAAQLTMVGPDKGDGSRRAVERLIAELELGDRVTLAGGVPKAEVPHRLAQGDVFLNTSRVDNAPVSVIEAMACGLCVVSTDAGGIPDLLAAGDDALLVPAGDPAAMAAAVHRLCTEPELAERLSRRGRERAGDWDWPVVYRRFRALVEGMVGEAARR
ncbi:MAG: glycosyltransferase [Acidobacteria bacterium]|nr:MAG: glycosyltransferase [Acidobacteriota bacterium]